MKPYPAPSRHVVAVTQAWPSARTANPDPPMPWPDHALVVVHQTARPKSGRLRFGMARLIGGKDPEPSWSFYGRGVRRSDARRSFGRDNPSPIFLEDFIEEAIRRSCQRPPLRSAFIAWSVPEFVSSAAWSVDAKWGAYRFTLRTWTNPIDGKVRPDFYRSRVRVTPSSSGVAQVGFDRSLDPDPQDFVTAPGGRPVFWRGRFLSLSTLAYALTGEDDITFARTLELYGIASPEGARAGFLAAELDATVILYRRLMADLALWQPNPAPDRIGSPAALAKAVARAAVGRTPRMRPGVSVRGNAGAVAAHAGGRDEIRFRHTPFPSVLADGTAFYPAVSALLGTGRWLSAERIEERRLTPGRGLVRLRRRLRVLADPDVLLNEPSVWPELCGVALVKPDDDVLTLRVLPAHEHDPTNAVTITAPVAKGSEPVWVALPDYIASALVTGHVSEFLDVRTWRPIGVVPGARAVKLPGDVVYDPRLTHLRRGDRFSDLGLALAEAELRLRDRDDAQAERLRGSLKIARNAAAYGIAAEVNPSKAKHSAWGPGGKVGEVREEPGNFADPPVAACVAAGGRLLLALLERLVHDAGGSIVRFDTDAATIVATIEGGDIPLIDGSGSGVRALSFDEVVSILNRFAPLVAATGLSIPAYRLEPLQDGGFRRIPSPPPGDLWSIFKLESENFEAEDRWTPGLEVMAVAEKR